MAWTDTGVSLSGTPGADGADGPPGADGRTVLNGSGTPSGGLGADGDFYIDTTPGAIKIFGPKTSGTWGSGTNIAGPAGSTGSTGSAGTNGKTVLNGAGAPAGGTGVDGDFYIDTTADAIYGPKAAGAWGGATSLIGPTGSTGATGADGNGLVWSQRVETIADSSSLTGNALSGLIQVGVCAALTQAAAVNPPSNGSVGAPYRYILTASGGTRVVTPTGFAASTDNGSGSAISVASGKTVVIFAQYIGASGWLYGGYELLQ
ncbi:MAG TPA: hypothetical protein VK735_18455 [Pseudonocardia sp.]|uniref:hypothetical protein n=1 Tax=Pseudonocardia sp. TaxID=60912 RepID=UPI002D014A1D|nr:hypothetical protein [Pseudonocardia sp.]HTF49428.1 hypothetical protein [Pseudonocardia sp.]